MNSHLAERRTARFLPLLGKYIVILILMAHFGLDRSVKVFLLLSRSLEYISRKMKPGPFFNGGKSFKIFIYEKVPLA